MVVHRITVTVVTTVAMETGTAMETTGTMAIVKPTVTTGMEIADLTAIATAQTTPITGTVMALMVTIMRTEMQEVTIMAIAVMGMAMEEAVIMGTVTPMGMEITTRTTAMKTTVEATTTTIVMADTKYPAIY
jgi:hypothetical protein